MAIFGTIEDHIIMDIPTMILLLLLTVSATSTTINSDSYVDLSTQGYAFTFSGNNGPVQLSITGLPQGLAIQNYTVTAVGPVQPGQYILSIKASDNSGQDQKMVIMNVNNSFTTYHPPTTSQPPSASSSVSTATITQTTSTSSYNIGSDVSSISALFQSTSSNAQSGGTESSSVDSLQSYFNGIDTTSNPVQTTPTIGNSLSQILTAFSNSSSTTESELSTDSSISAQTIVSQSSINLNFNNSQKSTVSTQEANALFQQQKQASEWVAGNYSIVLQITSDKNALNALIANLTEQYTNDQQVQKNAALQLNAAINNKSKIESAIGNLNGLLNTLQTQISASSSKLTQLQAQKQNISIQASQTQTANQQITQNIQSITNQIQSINASLANNVKTCDSYNANLLQANKTLTIYNSQLGLVIQQLNSATNDIAAKKAVVDDLMRQLAVAQQQLQLAQDNSNQLTAQKNQLQQNITSTGNSISSVSQSLNSCTAQSATIKQTLANQQADLAAQQTLLAQSINQNNGQSSQIATYQSSITQETANYNSLQSQINSATNGIALLQAALPNATQTIKVLTTAKNQVDLKLQEDLATLNAAIASFKNESANLELATMHLQNARALSQKADQNVNNMLAQRGNILPFAVAVNSTKNALIGQTIVSPNISIANWFNYLSANFGSAAYNYQGSNVQCLFPFTLASLNLRNSLPCPTDSDPQQTITGKVTAIRNFNEIVVAVDSSTSQVTVEIPSCANLSSNVGGYKVSVGDSALVKGSPQSASIILAKSIVFLRQ